MCKPIPVPYAKLKLIDRKRIADAYVGEIHPRVKCIKQFDDSYWILAPTGVSSGIIRSSINLRKKIAPAIYFTEFPFSALAMPRGVA